MLVLAVESSTRIASVALVKGSEVLGELTNDDPKSHSEFLNPAIDELFFQAGLKISDVEVFAVDIGPGSFTGIRVAVNIARTLAFLQNRPIFWQESLPLLLSQTQKNCIAIINAYKNMIFFSVQFDESKPTQSIVFPAKDLEAHLQQIGIQEPIRCVGDGYEAYFDEFSDSLKNILVRDPSLSDFPSARALALQSQSPNAQTLDWKSIIPLYLRASAAEENLKSK